MMISTAPATVAPAHDCVSWMSFSFQRPKRSNRGIDIANMGMVGHWKNDGLFSSAGDDVQIFTIFQQIRPNWRNADELMVNSIGQRLRHFHASQGRGNGEYRMKTALIALLLLVISVALISVSGAYLLEANRQDHTREYESE